ncbi:TetR/AcrR family transcriptional regulator [Nocardiopsis dassonvillei]|uniref:TetR/AcrR family transcriptional regulator n=1 Tax=Nocardiopsis dassonvillei TaxID=2014 RepID=UPI00200C0CA5|nr:TetR/AcrR family transcriptional regulator [Nocardiopsis dassonvillei]MCK9868205.1 TetR/AcrR family transcriptional regulator [Nocardiopsis dassonvillei]
MKDMKEASAPRTRNRRGQGGRLREEIVDAAVEMLDETGDERAITLRSLARRVGIAAPSIYPHFPDQPAIMLAVVRRAFDELEAALNTAVAQAGDDPRARLYAACHAYLGFARSRPERYRTMFGGLWMPTLGDSSVTEQDLVSLGDASLRVLGEALAACVEAGSSTSTDPGADAVGLWLGLHGLAHQRAVPRVFPGPEDIGERMIPALARLRRD